MLRGDLAGPGAIAELERVAADDAQSADTRRKAIEALGQSTLEAAAASLYRLLQPRGLIEIGSASALRDLAAVALKRSRSPAAAAYFEQGLQSTAWRVRKACARAAEGG
jgi:HEAT repeat protein